MVLEILGPEVRFHPFEFLKRDGERVVLRPVIRRRRPRGREAGRF
jgi:hypothetical protein